jgi:hypothetical protein
MPGLTGYVWELSLFVKIRLLRLPFCHPVVP